MNPIPSGSGLDAGSLRREDFPIRQVIRRGDTTVFDRKRELAADFNR